MQNAENGNRVLVHYTGRLADGTVFDSSRERDPIEFTLGEGMVIPGFEGAICGMAVNETKTVTIAAKDAYGEHRDELVMNFERANLPESMEPEVGQQVELRAPGGQAVPARITEVTETDVTVDANHPLSGKELLFELELVAISAEDSTDSHE